MTFLNAESRAQQMQIIAALESAQQKNTRWYGRTIA